MQLFNLTASLPVYLPYDHAHVPFGDPFNDVTITSSTTAAVTVPGYVPTVNDAVMFSVNSGGTIASGISSNFVYYVLAILSSSTGAFSLASSKGGSAIATTTSNSTSGAVTIHLLSNQVDGSLQPFKSGAQVVAINLGTTNVTLQGAADKNELAPGSIYPAGANPPGGPSTYSTIATVNSGTAALVSLSYDWINASGGNLILLQN